MDFQLDDETGRTKVHDGAKEIVGGMITNKTIKYTKTNKVMAFITLEDLVGSVEVVIFPRDFEKNQMYLNSANSAHCIDNGPMEGFWGILKREMYYKQRFNDRSSLITAIANYIDYYNNQRLQRKLHVMTPMKYHEQYTKAA